MTGHPVFLHGMLCHAPLLRAVAGADLTGRPARLPGHRVVCAPDGPVAVIRPEPGAVAEGLLVRDVGDEILRRLDFHAAVLGWRPGTCIVETAGGRETARVHLPERMPAAGAPWRLEDWAGRWGALAVAAAEEVMAVCASRAAGAIRRRYPQILVRAASRLRAGAGPAPVTRRRCAGPADVSVSRWRQPYARYFALEEADLRFRRFDGTMSGEVTRAVFVSGDAATVLPYDPVRDRVLLVEQFRAGPWGRGDPQPWQLEAIAGRIDPGETPEEAARREAEEEAGLRLGALVEVARYYPSPGAKSEFIYCFIALADLPDGLAGGVGGMADEHEDIRTHLVPFDELMRLVGTGEVENGQLLISALILAARRPAFRGAA
ncbi:MAG: NUDIX domain-containing protein [Rhodobacteraceae bacterium]|nr:NUDIX domain-containing protein [Paracoccaceae bacterium]